MTVTTKSIVDNLDKIIQMYLDWKDIDLLLESEEIKRRVIFYNEGLSYKTALTHIMKLAGIKNQTEIFDIAKKALNKE